YATLFRSTLPTHAAHDDRRRSRSPSRQAPECEPSHWPARELERPDAKRRLPDRAAGRAGGAGPGRPNRPRDRPPALQPPQPGKRDACNYPDEYARDGTGRSLPPASTPRQSPKYLAASVCNSYSHTPPTCDVPCCSTPSPLSSPSSVAAWDSGSIHGIRNAPPTTSCWRSAFPPLLCDRPCCRRTARFANTAAWSFEAASSTAASGYSRIAHRAVRRV